MLIKFKGCYTSGKYNFDHAIEAEVELKYCSCKGRDRHCDCCGQPTVESSQVYLVGPNRHREIFADDALLDFVIENGETASND